MPAVFTFLHVSRARVCTLSTLAVFTVFVFSFASSTSVYVKFCSLHSTVNTFYVEATYQMTYWVSIASGLTKDPYLCSNSLRTMECAAFSALEKLDIFPPS